MIVEENKIMMIKGKVQAWDILVVCCDIVMLVLFLWIHVIYQFDMLFVIIPLIILGGYFGFYCLVPYEYIFNTECLEIRHRFYKAQLIPYVSVYEYEMRTKDGFLHVTENNQVKLYYQEKKKYRFVRCNPGDIEMFVTLLKKRCEKLHSKKETKTRLEKLINK